MKEIKPLKYKRLEIIKVYSSLFQVQLTSAMLKILIGYNDTIF